MDKGKKAGKKTKTVKPPTAGTKAAKPRAASAKAAKPKTTSAKAINIKATSAQAANAKAANAKAINIKATSAQAATGSANAKAIEMEAAETGDLCPVVAIGASAGGLEPILQLLEALPGSTGAAFVILQHLPPDHESVLPQLLRSRTAMKTKTAEDGMPIEPDHVYAIPADSIPGLAGGHFALSTRKTAETVSHVIDDFLSVLATVYQNKAIAVILSGTITDGTAGIRSIKTEGGITFAQDETAQFQGMPHSAIDSGYVDFILPPDGIARELPNIIGGFYKNELRAETIAARKEDLRRIHYLLLKKHDIDFSLYKQTTIIRRIIRRMSLNRIGSLEQYIKMLSEDNREIDLLHRDLLISVTSFFREPGFYTALSKKIFPSLLKDRRPSDPIRIWIPACATGEEPYSVAICFFEYLKDNALSTPIQIFSTDLSELAINKARTGIYSKNALANISPQRLRKFFVRMDGHYQIIKPIRDICIFATHNLLEDPPFSRMDLISCQNVLIYMEQMAQKKIMQAFNYALKPNKYLVLGKSETVGSSVDLFEQLDKDLRIYMKKTAPANMHFDFSARSQNWAASPGPKDDKFSVSPPHKEVDVEKEAERVMLSLYMPASILINKDLQILRFYGSAFPYLRPASGKASLHLLKMIRDELIFELRTLIKQVKKDGKSARKHKVSLPGNTQPREISIEVQPIRTAPESHMLIVFQPSSVEAAAVPARRPAADRQEERDRRIVSLEKELKDAREHVKSITEDFEATREELQSANEEVLSSNEELQSINEELETSKEELQSTNEELITINEELQLRNNELKEAFDYSRAIIETIREPLMVLNTDLRILTVNQAFTASFKLGQDEVDGNFLYEIGNGMFDLPVLREQLRKMTVKNTWVQDFGLEHSFPGLGNKNLLINAMRMSGDSGKKPRILLAIEDITEGSTAKRALFVSEDGLREAQSRLAVALEAARMGFWDIDLRSNLLKRSSRFDQLLGIDPHLSQWDLHLAGQHVLGADRQAFLKALDWTGENGRINFTGRVRHEDGTRRIRLFGKVFYDGEQRPIRATGVIFDLSDQPNEE
jgi:two-component system CheB/CheR fusion protein